MRRRALPLMLWVFGLLVAASAAGADPAAPILAAPCPARVSQHRLIVRFTLANMTPAFVELADVAGRTIGRWPATAGVTGPQELDIGRDITVRPGLYLVRLTQGAYALTSTVVVRP